MASIVVAEAKLLDSNGKILEQDKTPILSLPAYGDFRRNVRAGRNFLVYGKYITGIEFCEVSSKHGSCISIDSDNMRATIIIDIKQCRKFSNLLEIPLKTIVGIALHHELGHLEATLRGEQDLGTLKNERRAWKYAKGFIAKRLPPSWSGIQMADYLAMEHLCMTSYMLDKSTPLEEAINEILGAAGKGKRTRNRILRTCMKIQEAGGGSTDDSTNFFSRAPFFLEPTYF